MWIIEVEGKQYKIELLISAMSRTKRLLIDGCLIVEKKILVGKFNHSTLITGHMLSIIENDSQFIISIDGKELSVDMEKEEELEDKYQTTDSSFIKQEGFSSNVENNVKYGGGSGEQPSDDLYSRSVNPYDGSWLEAPIEESSWSDVVSFEPKVVEQRPAIFAKQMAQNKKLQKKPPPKEEPKPLIDFDNFDFQLPIENMAPNAPTQKTIPGTPLVPISKPLAPSTIENKPNPPPATNNTPSTSLSNRMVDVKKNYMQNYMTQRHYMEDPFAVIYMQNAMNAYRPMMAGSAYWTSQAPIQSTNNMFNYF